MKIPLEPVENANPEPVSKKAKIDPPAPVNKVEKKIENKAD